LVRGEDVRWRGRGGGANEHDPKVAFKCPAGRPLRACSHDYLLAGCEWRGREGDREGRGSAAGLGGRDGEQGGGRLDGGRVGDGRVAYQRVQVVDRAVRLEPGEVLGLAEAVGPGHLIPEARPAVALRLGESTPRRGVGGQVRSHRELRGRARLDRCRPGAHVLAVSVSRAGDALITAAAGDVEELHLIAPFKELRPVCALCTRLQRRPLLASRTLAGRERPWGLLWLIVPSRASPGQPRRSSTFFGCVFRAGA